MSSIKFSDIVRFMGGRKSNPESKIYPLETDEDILLNDRIENIMKEGKPLREPRWRYISMDQVQLYAKNMSMVSISGDPNPFIGNIENEDRQPEIVHNPIQDK